MSLFQRGRHGGKIVRVEGDRVRQGAFEVEDERAAGGVDLERLHLVRAAAALRQREHVGARRAAGRLGRDGDGG